jgi:hypothetical protein
MSETLPSPAPPRRGVRAKRDQRVRRACRQVTIVAPHLDDPKYRPLVQSFARLSILSIDAFDHLRRVGITNDEGELRASVDSFQRLAMAQLRLAEKLGLTPAALGKLGKSRPVDLAAAMAAEVVEDGKDAR